MSTDKDYRAVGSALREADAIDSAFRAILSANFAVARRALAQAQVEHYGLKPWFHGAPVRDALGLQLVFEEFGDRYVIEMLEENGAQVRRWIGSRRAMHLDRRLEARGPSYDDACHVAAAYALVAPRTIFEIAGPVKTDHDVVSFRFVLTSV